MTQMALPMSYPSTRRAAPSSVPQPRWPLRGAEFTAALVISLGADPMAAQPAARYADRGIMMTAAAVAAPVTRPVAVAPPITSWTI